MRLTLSFVGLLLLSLSDAGAQVTLSWQDNSFNEKGFRIERAIGGGAFAPWGEVAPNITVFIDTAVAPASVYIYRVRSFTADGQSVPSNTAAVTTPVGGGAVSAAPSGVVATLPSELVNISARGHISGTDMTIIPGFVVGPGSGRSVLIRLIGPTLGAAPYNVPGVCADPRFEVRDSSDTILVAADDWSGVNLVAAAAAVGAFPLPAGSKDAALIITLPPGTYTVVARGVASATGVALAEVYAMP